MNPLLKDIRRNPLLWLLVFVPAVFIVEHMKPEAGTLLFVLSGTLMISRTLRIPKF